MRRAVGGSLSSASLFTVEAELRFCGMDTTNGLSRTQGVNIRASDPDAIDYLEFGQKNLFSIVLNNSGSVSALSFQNQRQCPPPNFL
ncbi:MAG: hypothetical protein SWO11_20630 [Thermodesulfobacteriota bacterium]|nr:hypothetical protein [Thermodesulfobacteriota bacterium]